MSPGSTIALVPEPADDWITVPEAARLLGLEPHTVYALIDRGELAGEVTLPPAQSAAGQCGSGARPLRTSSSGRG